MERGSGLDALRAGLSKAAPEFIYLVGLGMCLLDAGTGNDRLKIASAALPEAKPLLPVPVGLPHDCWNLLMD